MTDEFLIQIKLLPINCGNMG